MRRAHHLILPASLAIASIGAVAGVVGADAGAAAPAVSGPHVPGHVLVSFTAGTSASDQAAIEHANGATAIGSIPDLHTVILSVPVGAEQHVVDALKRSGKVTVAELDGVGQTTTTPNDTNWPNQWGPQKINAPTAWDTTTGSSSVVIADLDTGIDFSHSDLAGKTVGGYDFINNDADPSDDNGHGTATAGIIAADSNNAKGIAGMCWSCMIMPVKVASSTGSAPWSAVASGVTWATDHGARVINLSLGGSSASSTLQSAVQYAIDHGIVVVAAAGNNGSTSAFYPAAYTGVLSVAGTTSSDSLYSWSDYGSWVDVAAPGCDYATAMDGGYNASFCGTSAATPVVTGLAGLLVSGAPSATGATITNAIESSATPIGSVVAYGRVDAAAAISSVGSSTGTSPAPTTSPSPSPSPSAAPSLVTSTFSGSLNGKTTSRSYSVTAGADTLQASLTFNKAPAMTLQLMDATGNVVAQGSGANPVQVSASVTTGTYMLVVSSTSRGSFTLSVTYPSG